MSSNMAKPIEREVLEFANCGWPCMGTRARLEGLAALSKGPFAPRQPERWPSAAAKLQAHLTLREWRLLFWQDALREVWRARKGGEREQRLLAVVALYGAWAAGLDQVSRAQLKRLPSAIRAQLKKPADPFLGVLCLAYALLPHTKTCAHPRCARPFFLAKRDDQEVCPSAECRTWASRRDKLRSWNKHKHEWRPAKRKAARKRK